MTQPTLKTLATFDEAGGDSATGALVVDASGNIFGTTDAGDTYEGGGVFELSAGSAVPISIFAFGQTDSNGHYVLGASPSGGLIEDSAGNLYGVTSDGGPVGNDEADAISSFGQGTVFEIPAGTDDAKIIYSPITVQSFTGYVLSNDGVDPKGGLIIDKLGNLYGTTSEEGSTNGTGVSTGSGTVFEIAAGTKTETTLAVFPGGSGAADPLGPLVEDAAGNLYGTTAYGGSDGLGSIFEVAAGTNVVTTLASFDGTNGSLPEGGLVLDAAGNLYGTSTGGGGPYGLPLSDGNVFELAAGSQTITPLYSFGSTQGDGAAPFGGLIIDAAGNLFGTTTGGNTSQAATIFEINAVTQTLTTLATVAGPVYGALTADAAGNLYGGTANGGSTNEGTIFELTDSGFVVAVAATPPAPSVMQEDSHGIATTGALTVTGTAVAGSTVTLSDAAGVLATTTADSVTGAYSTTLSTPLADGSYALTVTATLNGLTSAASAATAVTVNADGPASDSWLGGDGDWADPAHWSAGLPPGSQTAVTLGGGGTITVESSETAVAQSIQIAGDALQVDGQLVTGSVAEAAGDLAIDGAAGSVAVTGGISLGVEAVARLSVSDGAQLSAGSLSSENDGEQSVTVDASSSIEIGGDTGTALAGTIQVDTGATIAGGWLQLFGAVVNDGTIKASSIVQIFGPVTGTGTLELTGGRFGLWDQIAGTQTIQFTGANQQVDLWQPTTAVFAGLAPGDGIDTGVVGFDSVQYTQTSADAGALQLLAGGGLVETINLAWRYTNSNFVTKSFFGSSDVVYAPPPTVNAAANPVADNAQAAVLGTAAGFGGDPLTIALTADADFASGSSVALSNGSIIYTPGVITAADTGSDLVTYTVTDTVTGATAQGQETVTLSNGPSPTVSLASTPTAANGTQAMLGSAAAGLGTDPLAVALTSDGDFVTGSTIALTDGNLIYTPGLVTAADVGSDSVSYTVTDTVTGAVTTETQTVTLDAGPAPVVTLASAPTATNASPATLGTAVVGFGSDPLSVTLTSDVDFVTGSSIALSGGTLIYTPGLVTAASAGSDTVAYTVTDTITGATTSETQSVALLPASLTTLVNFGGGNDEYPYSGVTEDAEGNLYGTTSGSNVGGGGSIYEIAKGSLLATTLVTFDGSNGSQPIAGLVADATGNLYGTARFGGDAADGTVFELAKGATAVTTIASFNGSNGSYPWAGLILDAEGNLYGVAETGGSANKGTVFEIAQGTSSITTLASFTGDTGAFPHGVLTIDAAGNLFGTTTYGGSDNNGTLFELSKGTSTITTLVNFDGSNGAYPAVGLTSDASGNFFGTTAVGGGYGTIFELPKDSSSLKTLATFSGVDGFNPEGPLAIDAAGDLFGTTEAGGSSDDGTVFELAKGATAITTLATFNGTDGGLPLTSLTADAAGNLFGTTWLGGANDRGFVDDGYGTIFELKNTGFVVAPSPFITLSGSSMAENAQSIALGTAVAGTDPLWVSLLSDSAFATGSTLALSNGALIYTPGLITTANAGLDTLSYTVTDTITGAITAKTQTVTLGNGPAPLVTLATTPTAANDTPATLGTALAGFGTDPLTVTLTGDSVFGIALAEGNSIALDANTIAYTPGIITTSNAGVDTISYTVTDSITGAVTTETQSVTLTPPAPVITSIVGPTYGGGTLTQTPGVTTITASFWGNTINAYTGPATIFAGAGNATVNGGNGNLAVTFDGWSNVLSAGNGDTTVSGSLGNSTVTLGNGDDTVNMGGWLNAITLGNGADNVVAGAGNASVAVGSGNDTITLGGYNNSVSAGNGNDTVSGGLGNDSITLGNGQGTVTESGYSNVITVGAGNDVITAGAGSETVHTGGGNDTITLAGYGNIVTSPGGSNTIQGGGSAGGNIITLTGVSQTVTLGGYNNVITLGGGTNSVVAGYGNDTVTAGAGNTSVTLQGWNDSVTLGAGTNSVTGGDGNETIHLSGGNATLQLHGWGDVVFLGGSSADIVDNAGGATLSVSAGGMDVIHNFNAGWSSVVDLTGGAGGYTSSAGALAALVDDGHGGSYLTLGAGSFVDFAGLAPQSLHDYNFKIG